MATILLVDGDPLQASLCKSILDRRFHTVLRVGDAAEALCLVEQPQFASNLGLVIGDLNMPGIGATAFVSELHERLPKVPVLLLGDAAEFRPTASSGCLRFLSRPFAGEQLLAAAGELMGQHSREAA